MKSKNSRKWLALVAVAGLLISFAHVLDDTDLVVEFRGKFHIKFGSDSQPRQQSGDSRRPDSSEYVPIFSEIADKYQQSRIDCAAVFAGDENETKRAVTVARLLAANGNPKTLSALRHKNESYVDAVHTQVKKWSSEFKESSAEWYLNATLNCSQFIQSRGYIMSALTQEEAEFPIAFSMVVYKDVEIVERLLRSVYRPQNFVCIHVDRKSSHKFYQAVQAVVGCLPGNVHLSTRRFKVKEVEIFYKPYWPRVSSKDKL
ncbi:beta-1,3-galactosyl-O-glycosyl-glycoprotein beta-1,6-N-acetylglucosaminyltransferase 3 [Elysia marginata]|uniref:Beta-1,3-galactosyl-O-glycosyl-glycoprotein beta-1,6-N-acetylglucosaminyltransferase 3 n=1 Tax=Elysia marginata TaxID=1093978 RepID=A0AAV4IT85_9GAST|nr:beta-1,3-galactosyl-O-glycosyl-glycoprotein beta-1,6-N-acetylglucosaminyltransferase 3 [Elysia marginata]